jgi:2'-5' RNA ligase
VAVPIGDELRASLAEYVAELRKAPWADAWRWTDPASWHVTLAFLGNISPSSVPVIADALREVAGRHTAFTVPTGGVGAFPSAQRPRVLWYGIEDSAAKLTNLASDVRSSLDVDQSDVLRGHITLARRRRGWTDELQRTPPPNVSKVERSTLKVEMIALVRSFNQTQTTYMLLATARL